MNETRERGGSATLIISHHRDKKWPLVRKALRSGATVHRRAQDQYFYVDCLDANDPVNGIGVSVTMVSNLVADRVLFQRDGDRYAFNRESAD